MARKALAALVVLLVGVSLTTAPHGQEPGLPGREDIPITGEGGPGLEILDAAVRAMMRRHGIPGGALAVAVEGRLVFAKGYGYADLETGETVRADTLFGLASLSKPITALAILKLLEEGKLTLDSKAFDILNEMAPPRGGRVDPRLATITVQQLLNHSGGWDRAVSGDPINWSAQMARRLGVPQPLTPAQFISCMMEVPLDFAPGTQAKYSNVGYVILGQIVEKLSGQSYEDYVQKKVLAPMGVRRAGINSGQKYLPGEARRYLAGSGAVLPPLQLPMVKAAGGWSASAVDMARFLTALDGSRGRPVLQEKTFRLMLAAPPPPLQPRADGNYCGLGWESVSVKPGSYAYFQDGNAHGMRTFMKRTPRGVSSVLLFNASMQPDLIDRQIATAAIQEIREAVERIENYPRIDFFKE